MMKNISQGRLKRLLTYIPETGEFIWNMDRGAMKEGDVAGTRSSRTPHRPIFLDGKSYYAGRLAFLYMTGKMPFSRDIEFLDGDASDTRWENMKLKAKRKK